MFMSEILTICLQYVAPAIIAGISGYILRPKMKRQDLLSEEIEEIVAADGSKTKREKRKYKWNVYICFLFYLIQIMVNIVAHPNKEQLKVLKVFLKAMKIRFEVIKEAEVVPDHVIMGIKKSQQQAAEGKVKKYTGIKDLLRWEYHEIFLYQ